jgi:hypothetical protein
MQLTKFKNLTKISLSEMEQFDFFEIKRFCLSMPILQLLILFSS